MHEKHFMGGTSHCVPCSSQKCARGRDCFPQQQKERTILALVELFAGWIVAMKDRRIYTIGVTTFETSTPGPTVDLEAKVGTGTSDDVGLHGGDRVEGVGVRHSGQSAGRSGVRAATEVVALRHGVARIGRVDSYLSTGP